MNIKFDNSVGLRLSFQPGEHILSAWLRYNLRSGLAHLGPERCRHYWEVPKQHQLKPQRIVDSVHNAISKKLTSSPDEHLELLLKHTVYRLWVLSWGDCLMPSEAQRGAIRPNQETNLLAFPISWQLCPKCAFEEKLRLGFSYWHREHQLPSITHCVHHGVALLSRPNLITLKDSRLPQHYLASSVSTASNEKVFLEWSQFLNQVDKKLEETPRYVQLWRNQINQHLDISKRAKNTERQLFQKMTDDMSDAVGRLLMGHLFKVRNGSFPNVVWLTLSGLGPAKSHRHPVYWLVIMFWLREHLSGLATIDEDT